MVMAFPYEVPDWMPNVLVRLSRCLSDPEPIASSVRKAFADFKRTHQDTWHEDSRKFTEDQLEQLMDLLVSPSYYA
jgi:proteasome activator subunit 4